MGSNEDRGRRRSESEHPGSGRPPSERPGQEESGVTIELERTHTTLLEQLNVPEGYRAEIVNGEIILSPTRAFHLGTIFELLRQITPQLPPDMWFAGDNVTPFPGASELCPDIILLPRAEYEKNSAVYPVEVIEAAFEVVSPATRARDYGLKVDAYAEAGIPVYVIADPYAARLTVHWDPAGGEYANRRRVAYGDTVDVPGKLPFTLDTAMLPAEQA